MVYALWLAGKIESNPCQMHRPKPQSIDDRIDRIIITVSKYISSDVKNKNVLQIHE